LIYRTYTYKITDKITLVGKYNKYKFNFNNNRDSSTEYTLGTNYYITKNLKLQANLVRVSNKNYTNFYKISITDTLFFLKHYIIK
jgi:phosphate-selective porin